MPDVVSAVMRDIAQRWGGRARLIFRDLVLTTTGPTEIAPFNFDRVFLLFANGDADIIAVWPSNQVNGQVASFYGIRLAAAGGLVSFNAPTDAIMPCYQWFAAPQSQPLRILIIEVVLETKV